METPRPLPTLPAVRYQAMIGFMALLSFTGCNDSAPESSRTPNPPDESVALPDPLPDLPGAQRVIETSGDARRGTIVHLRQSHGVGDEILLNLERMGGSEAAMDFMREIATHQYFVLRSLERLAPTDLFSENMDRRSIERLAEILGSRSVREAAAAFRSLPTDPIQMSVEQIRALYHVGPALIYRALHPEVRLRETSSRELMLQAYRLRDESMEREESFSDTAEFRRLDEEREDFTVARIMEFLDRHPGRRIVLIYGQAHDLENNLENLGISQPHLFTVDY